MKKMLDAVVRCTAAFDIFYTCKFMYENKDGVQFSDIFFLIYLVIQETYIEVVWQFGFSFLCILLNCCI